MSKLVVKYHNDMNTIPFRKFTAAELNIFLTICASIKEKGTDTVIYDFAKIKELAKYESHSIPRFMGDLESTYDKLLGLNVKIRRDGGFKGLNFFQEYDVDEFAQTVKIQVSESFQYILNDLTLEIGNFTLFELEEYTAIDSVYVKIIYMNLKKWKTTGKWEISLDEFKKLLDIPDSYRMTNIDQQILTPAKKELNLYFLGLKVTKLDRRDKPSGKGRPVKKLRFTFQQQNGNTKKSKSKVIKAAKNEPPEPIEITPEEREEMIARINRGLTFGSTEVDPNQMTLEDIN